MHPCQEQIESYIHSQSRPEYVERLRAFLVSLKLHDGYAFGVFVGAAIVIPAKPPETLLSQGWSLYEWIRTKKDLFPKGEAQKVILLHSFTRHSDYLSEADSLGAFDVGSIDEMLPALFAGYEAANATIEHRVRQDAERSQVGS